MPKESQFVHLHVHSEYSLLDGAIIIKDLIKKCKDTNMPAVALTDHGAMFGVVEFYQEAKKQGIKPIIGCELYLAPRTRFDKDPQFDRSAFHLTFLVKNEIGYKNLLKLVTLANIEGLFYKPRVDFELIAKHSEGLICLTGCMQGPISQKILNHDINGAKEVAKQLLSIFQNDLYYEIQDNAIPEQKILLKEGVKIAQELGISLVATNDCHYLNKEDYLVQDILLAIQTGKTLQDQKRLSLSTHEFYLKTPQEMSSLFHLLPEAVSNTLLIAEKCNFELNLNRQLLPKFQVPEGETDNSYMEKLAYEGLEKKYPKITTEVKMRAEYELEVIKKMGFASYFLIVSDFINYAKKNNISVGPGRGSAAGSIIAYALGITNIDPLRFSLLFERFLNPSRISMPDIDIDFCIDKRSKVIDYTKEKYGEDCVAQIATFGKMAARMAIRDVGRVLDVPLKEVDQAAKLIPFGFTIAKTLEETHELKTLCQNNEKIKELIDIAQKIEGITRQSGIHAAGVVISQNPLVNETPLFVRDGQLVTMFSKDDIEKIGLLKMDFLGLRNLTMIAKSLEIIKNNQQKNVDIENIPLDDQETFKLLSNGQSIGVFQLESGGMQQLLKAMQPTVFDDIIALLALYRPGPLGSGMDKDFVNRKHGREAIKYPLPQLESILKDTYGTILYQEQVMQISAEVGGFSLAEADTLRKAMGKKQKDIMDKMKESFIDGAVKKNINKKKAAEIFDMMAKFAEYGFNKSHSAAYALITYQTAYLKTHYPVEYMAALISSSMSDTDKVSLYICEAKNMGIDILPPDVNESALGFSVKNGNILFGLNAIKNVGENAIESIINARQEKGLFPSLTELLSRVDLRLVNKRVVESLIKAGALDNLGKRKALLLILDTAFNEASKYQKELEKGQLNLFGEKTEQLSKKDFNLSDEEFPNLVKLKFEKELIGIYLSGHPLESCAALIKKKNMSQIIDFLETEIVDDKGIEVSFLGILTNTSKKLTKAKKTMLVGTIEDFTGSLPCVVFPYIYEKISLLLEEDTILIIQGTLNSRNDQKQLIIEDLKKFDNTDLPLSYIEIDTQNCDLKNIKEAITSHKGKIPIILKKDGYKIKLAASMCVNEKCVPLLEAIAGKERITLV